MHLGNHKQNKIKRLEPCCVHAKNLQPRHAHQIEIRGVFILEEDAENTKTRNFVGPKNVILYYASFWAES